MQFLYPSYLYALSLIAIPIIIHLFKLRRYRTVYFSSLKFLGEAQSSHKNKSRLRDILLLIIRCLFIILIVLAFAQPIRNGDSLGLNRKAETVGIYIDRSLSMKNQGINGTLLNQAKSLALEKINEFPLETQFLIIQADDANTLKIKLDRYEAEEKIRTLELSSSSARLEELLLQLENTIKKPIPVFVYSDFQKSFLRATELPDSSQFNVFIQLVSPQNDNNIFIDTCWLTMPIHHFGSRIQITGKITNTGELGYKQFPLTLTVNDSLVSQTTIQLEESSSTDFTISYLPFETGWQNCILHFNDYPIDFDNSHFLSFSLNEKIRVCHLFDNEANEYIEAAFDNDSMFIYSSYPASGFPESDFNNYQTVIICNLDKFEGDLIDKLEEFVSLGGNLILFPPEEFDKVEVNRLSKRFGAPSLLDLLEGPEMAKLSKDMNDFFREISLNTDKQLAWPQFTQYYRVSIPGITTRSLIETQVGRPILLQTKFGNGSYSLATFDLSKTFTSLPEHPLFIPVIYYLSTAEIRNPQLYSRIGSSDPYSFRNSEKRQNPIEFFDLESNFSVIPQQETKQNEQLTNVFLNDWVGDARFLMTGWPDGYYESIAMNYSRYESLMEFYSVLELDDIINAYNLDYLHFQSNDNAVERISSSNSSSDKFPYSKILLLVALLLYIFESLIYRLKI